MRQNEETHQATPIHRPKALFVHPDIHRRMKIHVITHGGSMQESAEQAINEWLDRQEREGQR